MEGIDLKFIKKHYGENFAKMCREYFPTILEQQGLLTEIIFFLFPPSRHLYEDIVNEGLENEFKSYIYAIFDHENKIKANIKNMTDVDKTPEQLLDKAGYILFPECKTEEDVQAFKKYYSKGEELCTFKGERLNSCRIWFAVKKDVESIRRENFENPQREDEYGTSVISIQFTKTKPNILSIKNRYNHAVRNPDCTFGNDLDNIIDGLTQSFIKSYSLDLDNELYGDETSELDDNLSLSFEIPGYVQARDGRFYKSNLEARHINYCSIDNSIVTHDDVYYYDKSRYIILDHFLIDLQEKQIKDPFPELSSNVEKQYFKSFIDSIGPIKNIKVERVDDNKVIYITPKDNDGIVKITLDKDNNFIEYSNPYVKKIGDGFLYYNQSLQKLDLPNLEECGELFLPSNLVLSELNLPKLTKCGSLFLIKNKSLSTLDLPNLQECGDAFLQRNMDLRQLNVPNLRKCGSKFLYSNNGILNLSMPKLQVCGDGFFSFNETLRTIDLPCLESCGDGFLRSNNYLKNLLPTLLEFRNLF